MASQLRKTILKAKAENGQEEIKVLCTFCGMKIERPKLRVTIGKKLHKKDDAGAKEIETAFISAEELFNNISRILIKETELKVDLNEFRSAANHQQNFWNLIYYFNEYHLPFEFILPY